jgi:tetratricopeptide (TPR) repeat protein
VAADVYALGALLYTLLTGRPPFLRGDNILETLRQVVEAEPASPRSLNPAVPRDLETVCLRCLRKEPTRRYHSALALADDLEHWLRGEPVAARAVGRLERLWLWARRNPAVAGMTVALLLLLVGATVAATLAAWRFRTPAASEAEARAGEQAKAEQIEADLDKLIQADALIERGRYRELQAAWARASDDYTQATELRPEMYQVWAARGRFFLRVGLLDEAAADLDRAFAIHKPSDPALWFFRACLRVYQGDTEGYRRVCADMLEHFPDPGNPELARWLVRTCTLAPGAVKDPERLVPLARQGEDLRRKDESQFVLRAALYRAGKDPSTIPPLDQSVSPGMDPRTIAEFTLQALIEHRLRQADKAKQVAIVASEWALQAHWALVAQPLGMPPEEGGRGHRPCAGRRREPGRLAGGVRALAGGRRDHDRSPSRVAAALGAARPGLRRARPAGGGGASPGTGPGLESGRRVVAVRAGAVPRPGRALGGDGPGPDPCVRRDPAESGRAANPGRHPLCPRRPVAGGRNVPGPGPAERPQLPRRFSAPRRGLHRAGKMGPGRSALCPCHQPVALLAGQEAPPLPWSCTRSRGEQPPRTLLKEVVRNEELARRLFTPSCIFAAVVSDRLRWIVVMPRLRWLVEHGKIKDAARLVVITLEHPGPGKLLGPNDQACIELAPVEAVFKELAKQPRSKLSGLWAARGTWLAQQLRPREAAAAFLHALESARPGADPDAALAPAYQQITAYVYRQLIENNAVFTEWQEAVAQLKKLAKDNPQTWVHSAKLRFARGDLDGAATDLARALDLVPEKEPADWIYKTARQEGGDLLSKLTERRPRDARLVVSWANDPAYNRRRPNQAEKVLTGALKLRPNDKLLLQTRGYLYLDCGQWEKAAVDFAVLFRHHDPGKDTYLWYMGGAGLAAGGKTEEYREVCTRMHERFGQTQDPEAAHRTAIVCLFLPDAPGDRKKLEALAEKGYEADRAAPWNVIALALAHTRAGQHEKAIKLVEEYQQAYPKGSALGHREQNQITLTLVLGMAQARLGRADKARFQLSEGLKRLAQTYPPGSNQLRLPGHGWVQCHALRREAEEVLKSLPKESRKKE